MCLCHDVSFQFTVCDHSSLKYNISIQVHTLIAENNHLRTIIAQAGLTTSRGTLPNGHLPGLSESPRSSTPTMSSALIGGRSPRSSTHQRPVSMYEQRSQLGRASTPPSMAAITGSYSNLSSFEPEVCACVRLVCINF